MGIHVQLMSFHVPCLQSFSQIQPLFGVALGGVVLSVFLLDQSDKTHQKEVTMEYDLESTNI